MTTGPARPNRRFASIWLGGILAAAIAGCPSTLDSGALSQATDLAAGGPRGAAGESSGTSNTGKTGEMVPDEHAAHHGLPAASPSPGSAAPGPTSQPTPIRVVSVTLTPGIVTLYAPPQAGPASPRYPSDRTMEVGILHNDLSVVNTALWEIEPADIATVSANGWLRALGKEGTASVVARAPSGMASSPSLVTVRRAGGIAAAVSSDGIPPGTARLVVSASGSGYSRNIDLSPSALHTEFSEAPAGSLSLTAEAFDGAGAVLASASATVIVQSGAIITAELGLVRGIAPTVASMSILAAGVGYQIELKGAGFGSDPVSEPFKILVDGVYLPTSGVFRTSPSQAFFIVPAWAARSAVTVDVAGRRATAPVNLVRLARIDLEPGSLALAVGATASLGAVGTDIFGGSWPRTPVTWLPVVAAESHSHDHPAGSPATGHPDAPLSVGPDGLLRATGTGSFHVLARHGDLQASASVTIAP